MWNREKFLVVGMSLVGLVTAAPAVLPLLKPVLAELESTKQAERELQIPPATSQDYFRRGTAYVKTGALEAAIRDFDSAIKLDPTYAEAFMGRSSARAMMGDKAGADADLRASFNMARRKSIN
jgi:Flp pilus assembly protein TadD